MYLIPILGLNLVLTATLRSSHGYLSLFRAARPIMLIERMRNVRRICGNIINMIPKILNVGILLGVLNLFFGIMAYVLFAGIDGENCTAFPVHYKPSGPGALGREGPPCSTFLPDSCNDYYSSLTESMWQLFILTTTANYPDVMLPVYSCNTWSAWFFVLYFLVGASFLLNLTLAVALDEFKALTRRKVLERYDSMFVGFDMAYRELLIRDGSLGGPALRTRPVKNRQLSDKNGPKGWQSSRRLSPSTSEAAFEELERKAGMQLHL